MTEGPQKGTYIYTYHHGQNWQQDSCAFRSRKVCFHLVLAGRGPMMMLWLNQEMPSQLEAGKGA